MSSRRVKCPKCGAVLQLPQGCLAAAVHCGACRTAFRLPPPGPVPDETIAGWLGGGSDQEDEAASTAAPAESPPPQAESATPDEPTASVKGLRMVSLERRGVLLEFPPKMLHSERLPLRPAPLLCRHTAWQRAICPLT